MTAVTVPVEAGRPPNATGRGLTRDRPANRDFRKRFPDGLGPESHTCYDEPDSVLELFTAPCAAYESDLRVGPEVHGLPKFRASQEIRLTQAA